MTIAASSIGGATALAFVVQSLTPAMSEEAAAGNVERGASLLRLFVVGQLLAAVSAGVCFGLWIHRAAINLRAFRRRDMRYSPGECVWWFYVPVANLVHPFRAVREIWRASDPNAKSRSWQRSSSTQLLGIWWGTYLASCTLAGWSASFGLPGFAFLGTACEAVAAVAIIMLMHRIGVRQELLAERRREKRLGPSSG
jgi:hypothetical protein